LALLPALAMDLGSLLASSLNKHIATSSSDFDMAFDTPNSSLGSPCESMAAYNKLVFWECQVHVMRVSQQQNVQ
jgi:hypothetical protein